MTFGTHPANSDKILLKPSKSRLTLIETVGQYESVGWQAMTATGQKQLCPNPKCGAENDLRANMCPKCGTPQRQLLARGTVLQGRYQIEAVRGCGGFGAVYRAKDLQTGQTVAIKENQRHQTFQRFEREGKLLMNLSHPNLPKVWEVFVDQTTGRAFLVMDFIDGETLEEMLQRLQRPLTWQEAQPITALRKVLIPNFLAQTHQEAESVFAQVVNALNYLHSNKIVHRDIKPSNIIVMKRMETIYEEVDDWEEVVLPPPAMPKEVLQLEADDWEEVVVPPPSLTENQVAAETNPKRFEQGMNYWRDKWRLEGLQRDGWMLLGRCWGDVNVATKKRRLYSVRVELAKNGIGKRFCECYDFHGRRLCKHLVALLLAWVHEPAKFRVIAEKKERRPVKRLVSQLRNSFRFIQLQRQEWTLSGICWDERDRQGYAVRFSLTEGGSITGHHCSCSGRLPTWLGYSPKRFCAHLGAFLARWIYEPKSFQVVAEKKERRPVKRRVPRQVERQWVMLVDFGVAKVMEEVDLKRPRSSSIIAWTDGYSPPEQYVSGSQIDARADQYALAATMVFALTGKTPDDAFTRMEKFRKGEPTLPAKPDGVSESVWKAIEVAMRFEPNQRFSSVTDFWEAVQGRRKLPVETAVAKLRTKMELNLIWKAVLGAVTGAILGAIGSAIVVAILFATLGAILSAIGLKPKGTTEDAFFGIIFGAILGAIGGAIEGIEKRKR